MSIVKLGERLLAKAVPTVQAEANCGRCSKRYTGGCCRRFFRRYNLIDVCGNLCGTGCDYHPYVCTEA